MMQHPSANELELYVMGAHEGLAVNDVEAHLAECSDCSAAVRREARLELSLLDLAARVGECPGCRRVVAAARCAFCGAAAQAGGFRVLGVLVQNAHGRLYLAEDAQGRRVALKELAFLQAPGPEAIGAFEREARFLRALEHPRIPRFVASFQEGEGVQTRLFLAQEHIEGESLQARLADHWFDEDEVIAVAREVLEILVYLQELSPIVVHGDVKPANLVRRPDGSIALVDFGAARAFGVTAATSVVGTFGYMPIEQLAGAVNPTTDLYGLGASLVQLLSREEPWKMLEDPGALGRLNVSPELRRYLGKLAARRAVDRFPNARAALDALTRLRVKTPRRKPLLFAAAIAAAALLAGAAGFGIAHLTMRSDNAPPAPRYHFEMEGPLKSSMPLPMPVAPPAAALFSFPPPGDLVAIHPTAHFPMLASYKVDGGLDQLLTPIPEDITDLAMGEAPGQWYVIKDSVVSELVVQQNDHGWPKIAFRSLEDEIGAPELVGPTALAFDSRRGRLVVYARGDLEAPGTLFAYDTRTGRWSRLTTIDKVLLESMAYLADQDVFYGVSSEGTLYRIGPAGEHLGHRKIAVEGLDQELDDEETFEDRFEDEPIQLVSAKGRLFIIRQDRLVPVEPIAR